MVGMTHDNDFPPLFDDTPSDDADAAARAVYARPSSDDADAKPTVPETPVEEPAPHSDAVDIDSALAALASLQELAFQDDPYTDEEYAPLEDVPDLAHEAPSEPPRPVTGEWSAVPVPAATAPTWAAPLTEAKRPAMLTLERGQPASIVAAVLLIGGGAWGVFLIASGGTLPVGQLPAVAMAALGIALLALWFSGGRRSDGSVFGGMVLLALGLTTGILTQTDTWGQNYALLGLALGAACLVSSAGIAAYRRWLILFGLSFLLGGIGVFAAASQNLVPQVTALLPVVLIAAVLLPLLLRLLVPTLPSRQRPVEPPAELPLEAEPPAAEPAQS